MAMANTVKRYPEYFPLTQPSSKEGRIRCNWEALRMQLLLQWKRLTPREIDETGPSRHGLALLIQRRYGIACELIENYLMNFERTLPLG